MFGFLAARGDALAEAHGGGGGAAEPVEGGGGAEGVGVEFKVHVRGQLGVPVGVEVGGRAGAAGLAEGVEVLGPPDRVPDLEVLDPVAVVDGARVGGVPRLPGVGPFGGHRYVGEDGGFVFDGVVGDFGGDAVEDDDGAGGRRWGFLVVKDGEDWDWMRGGLPVRAVVNGRLGGSGICRRHGDHGGGCRRTHCRGLH